MPGLYVVATIGKDASWIAVLMVTKEDFKHPFDPEKIYLGPLPEQPENKGEIGKFYCPQCGFKTTTLNEGYCEPCRIENQAKLDYHNAKQDEWNKMSDSEREAEIKRAMQWNGKEWLDV